VNIEEVGEGVEYLEACTRVRVSAFVLVCVCVCVCVECCVFLCMFSGKRVRGNVCYIAKIATNRRWRKSQAEKVKRRSKKQRRGRAVRQRGRRLYEAMINVWRCSIQTVLN